MNMMIENVNIPNTIFDISKISEFTKIVVKNNIIALIFNMNKSKYPSFLFVLKKRSIQKPGTEWRNRSFCCGPETRADRRFHD